MINIEKKINHWIWEATPSENAKWLTIPQKIVRLFYVVIRDLTDGQLTLRAMSLVYTTLLSLVPLLAFSFSVLKGFGVHNQVEPLLLNLLAPLGEQGVEIANRIIEFVGNVKVGLLGSLGLVLLLYTVISLLQKIERAFNYTWSVAQTRSFAQRFSDYLSVIFVGPILIFSAIGLTATVTTADTFQQLQQLPGVGILITFAGKLVPYALIILAFTFIYILVPNTRVKLKPAFIGALISGILWESTGWLFASFLLGSAKYTAIYSAFATLIFFLIWLYLSWAILLIGASIAFYVQNPEYITRRKISFDISNLAREYLAVQIMYEICKRYDHQQKEVTLEELISSTGVPSMILTRIVNHLKREGYIVGTADEPAQYYPARPLQSMAIAGFLKDLREDGQGYQFDSDSLRDKTVIDELFHSLDTHLDESLSGKTFQDLVDETKH